MEIFLNSERSIFSNTRCNTSYMSICYEIYLRLKQRWRKFWTVVNSGIEEAYIRRPNVVADTEEGPGGPCPLIFNPK